MIAALDIKLPTDPLTKLEVPPTIVPNKEFVNNQDTEKTFVSKITEKYGDGQLNIDTGTFTPKETKKEDSKENK